jgi:murein DD-endopeptidase MepM/ murein hydrolase activator NlpD
MTRASSSSRCRSFVVAVSLFAATPIAAQTPDRGAPPGLPTKPAEVMAGAVLAKQLGTAGLTISAGSDAHDGSAAPSASPIRFGRALDLEGNPIRLVPGRGTGLTSARKFRWSGAVSVPSGFPVRAVSLSSGFGPRSHPILGISRFHSGIDLTASTGTAVSATAAGMVANSGWCGGLGWCVVVDHGGGYTTVYGHMSSIDVQAGQEIHSGQRVGLVGSTGQSTGPHLHYEVRFRDQPLNPKKFL